MSQALEMYNQVLIAIEVSVKAVQVLTGGREITLSMIATDHELPALMRKLVSVTHRTQLAVRTETAVTFSESLFNRMFETLSTTFPDTLRLEAFVSVLDAIRETCGGAKVFNPDFIAWLGKYAVLVSNDETSRKMYRLILILLIRAKLVRSTDIDSYFVLYIDGGRNLFWLELALSFIRQCLVEGLASIYDFTNTFETVTKMRPTNMVLKKQLQKWLSDIKQLTAAQEEQTTTGTVASGATSVTSQSQREAIERDGQVKQHVTDVTLLLERWLRVWNSVNDHIFGQYLQLMHQYGVLKTEEAADRFFRLATEICADACIKTAAPAPTPPQPAADSSDASVVSNNSGSGSSIGEAGASTLNYTVVDALSKLFLLLVRLADKEAGDLTVRVNLLSRILNAVARTLLEDHEAKKASGKPFDQRPFFRLFSNLSQDLSEHDPKQEPNPAIFPLLNAYTQVYLALQPSTLPGFAYAWVQLISRRSFMPHLLLVKGQKGWPLMHRLLGALLMFLQPFLKVPRLEEPVKRLYKGTLRILLVLLHDFPEFLSDFHLSFCDQIPMNCVQLRNLILSAFPKAMRLPDPFTPNLKVDVLHDNSLSPRILTDYVAPINTIRSHLDNYLLTRQPADLPAKLHTVLMTSTGTYNVSIITSLVVYVGAMAINQLQQSSGKVVAAGGSSTAGSTGGSSTTGVPISMNNSPALEMYRQLALSLDAEGRYILFNTMANQLRYPNSHTHFFSFVLLHLFHESDDMEIIQEHITRVLLERLIAQRPHPWGLLITFVELIKNPKYAFWTKPFTKSAPEIVRVFDSIAKSCMGPAAAAAVIQQQLGVVALGSAPVTTE